MMVDRDLARRRHQQGVAVGRRLGDALAAIIAAAPVRFSTTTGWRERGLHRLAQQTRHESTPPPAG